MYIIYMKIFVRVRLRLFQKKLLRKLFVIREGGTYCTLLFKISLWKVLLYIHLSSVRVISVFSADEYIFSVKTFNFILLTQWHTHILSVMVCMAVICIYFIQIARILLILDMIDILCWFYSNFLAYKLNIEDQSKPQSAKIFAFEENICISHR